MVIALLFAFGLISATVIVYLLGTLASFAHLSRVRQRKKGKPGRLASEVQIARVVSVLLLLHLIESGIWAGFYRVSGVLPDFETAIYFSITSYTTVGYGDILLSPPWRLLGPIEAAVGILMFGWSTGIVVAAITRIYSLQAAGDSKYVSKE